MRPEAVIQALDVASIYDVPLAYHREGLDTEVLDVFGIRDAPEPNLGRWEEVVERRLNPDGQVTVAVVGKYTVLKDAYKSLIEALVHGLSMQLPLREPGSVNEAGLLIDRLMKVLTHRPID